MFSIGTYVHMLKCFEQVFTLAACGRIETDIGQAQSVRLSGVIEFMRVNARRSCSLDEIARKANLSKFHFVRLFKSVVGTSPMAYLNRLRIQQACELLENPELTIKEIAAELGFVDQYCFSAAFRKTMGHSPSAYRKLRTYGF